MRQNYKKRAWELFKTSKHQSEYLLYVAEKVNIAQNENTSPQYNHPCIIRNLLLLQFSTFSIIYIHGSQLVLFSRKLEDTLDRDRLYLSLQKSLQPPTSLVKNISQLYSGTFTWRPFTLINTKRVQQWEKVVDPGGGKNRLTYWNCERWQWRSGSTTLPSTPKAIGDWYEQCCELKGPIFKF